MTALWTKTRVSLVAVLVVLFAVPVTIAGSLAQDGTTSLVEIAIYTCPAGTDPASDPALLAESCLEPAEPVLVTVGSNETWVASAETTGEAPHQVALDDIPSGWISIVWEMPEGLEVATATCTVGESDEQSPQVVWQFFGNVTGNRMFLEPVPSGSSLTCQIFHLQTGPTATPAASPVA